MVVVVSAGWVVEQECGSSWGGGELVAGGSYAVGKTPRTSACSAGSLFGTGETFLSPALYLLMMQVVGAGVVVTCTTYFLGSN